MQKRRIRNRRKQRKESRGTRGPRNPHPDPHMRDWAGGTVGQSLRQTGMREAAFARLKSSFRSTSYFNPKNTLEKETCGERQDKEQPDPVPFESHESYLPKGILNVDGLDTRS